MLAFFAFQPLRQTADKNHHIGLIGCGDGLIIAAGIVTSDQAALCIQHISIGFSPYTGQRSHRLRRRAVVVTEQHIRVVRVRADHRQSLDVLAKRQEVVLITQQHHRLLSCPQRQCVVFRRIVDLKRNAAVGCRFRWVEHTQTHSGLHQSFDRPINGGFVNQTLLNCTHKRIIGVTAVEVTTSINCQRCRLFASLHQFVMGINIHNRPAVGYNMTVKSPLLAQNLAQQCRAGTTRFTVGAVIGPHDRLNLRLNNRRLKRR